MNRSPKAKELAALKQLLLLYGDHSPFLYADFVNVKKGIVRKTVIEQSFLVTEFIEVTLDCF